MLGLQLQHFEMNMFPGVLDYSDYVNNAMDEKCFVTQLASPCTKCLESGEFVYHVMCRHGGDSDWASAKSSLLCSSWIASSSSSSSKSQPQPAPKQTSSILHPLPRESSSNLHRALHPTSTAALLLPFFSDSRFAQHSLIPPRQTRDTAHQSQSQLAFPSIGFRIAINCALDLSSASCY